MSDSKLADTPLNAVWPRDPKKSPHNHIPLTPRPKILPSVLGAIGLTPMVRLDRLAKKHGLTCELIAKCEYFNAGGSVKDRIGLRMIEEAEKSGRIKPGDTLIEPTSGNTGIGLALAAAVKGYHMIITLPMKMSLEKVNVLKALGAEIIRTPTEAAWDSPESHISVAQRLNKEIPNSHILDQYANVYNPIAHYDSTAEEILEACDNKIDLLVISAGTGGTLTGISRKIREKCPSCKILGVDPHGSILAVPESLNGAISTYQVEGIGYDFIPLVCEQDAADTWVKSSDKESFLMAREMIRYEGLLCGGSSGTAMYCAIEAARALGPGQRCVVILPDSVRNYMSKFLDPMWMVERDFADSSLLEEVNPVSEWWSQLPVSSLELSVPVTISPTVTVGDAIGIITKTGYDQLPVVDNDKSILGTVTEGNLLAKLRQGKTKLDDPVSTVLYKEFKKVANTTSLGQLSRLFDRDTFVLVVTSSKCFVGPDKFAIVETILGVATRVDLLKFIMKPKA
jgi:cystathionine beta-synthase